MIFNQFHCNCCGINFTVDLEPTEVRCCPFCADAGHTICVNGEPVVECKNCGARITESESRNCLKCAAILCPDCWHSEECRDCGFAVKISDNIVSAIQ
jgi:hypothetical protein